MVLKQKEVPIEPIRLSKIEGLFKNSVKKIKKINIKLGSW